MLANILCPHTKFWEKGTFYSLCKKYNIVRCSNMTIGRTLICLSTNATRNTLFLRETSCANIVCLDLHTRFWNFGHFKICHSCIVNNGSNTASLDYISYQVIHAVMHYKVLVTVGSIFEHGSRTLGSVRKWVERKVKRSTPYLCAAAWTDRISKDNKLDRLALVLVWTMLASRNNPCL
jgi:hypothetical protein